MTTNLSECGIPEKAQDKIKSVFALHPNIFKAWLYGSRAIGNYRTGSDIDLCLEGALLTSTDLFQIENQLDDLLLPWKIDLSSKQTIDNAALLEHIEQFGKVFYEPK